MIDTHIHLDEEAYAPDLEEVIARQRANGVEAMIIPGVNAGSIDAILNICRRHQDCCYPALGFHPQDVEADWKEQWNIIEKAIRDHCNEIVAVGEIGLDYYWDTTYKTEQQELFRLQLSLAQELNLPVMIHNRDATEDTLAILKSQIKNHKSPLRGVIHCFNGSHEVAKQILDMGFYFGIGGVLTFKNCKLSEALAGNERFERIPLERLVLETDGPYLAPVPYRGRRNESRWMIQVAEALTKVYECSVEEIVTATNTNARLLFGIK